MSSRRRNLEAPIDLWYEFKESMSKRFVPQYFQRDMAHKLQALKQGCKSVEDYYKDMDTLMDRIDLDKDMEALMARFLHGLNTEIADKTDLQPYSDIEERGKSNEGLNGILLKIFPILLLHGKMIVRTLIISIEIKTLMRSLKLNLRKVRVLEKEKKK